MALLIADPDNLTFDEIGERLSISGRTVKAHADKIRLKIGANKKRQIPKRLRDLGLLD